MLNKAIKFVAALGLITAIGTTAALRRVLLVLARRRRHDLLQLPLIFRPLHFTRAGHGVPPQTGETDMFIKLIGAITGAALAVVIGVAAASQAAQAAPWCYKTGPNTVQCTR